MIINVRMKNNLKFFYIWLETHLQDQFRITSIWYYPYSKKTHVYGWLIPWNFLRIILKIVIFPVFYLVISSLASFSSLVCWQSHLQKKQSRTLLFILQRPLITESSRWSSAPTKREIAWKRIVFSSIALIVKKLIFWKF